MKLERPHACLAYGCRLTIEELGPDHVFHHTMPGQQVAGSYIISTYNLTTLNIPDIQMYLNFWVASEHEAYLKEKYSAPPQQTGAQTVTAPSSPTVMYDLYGNPIRFQDEEDLTPTWTNEQIAAAKLVVKNRKVLGKKIFWEMAADNGCQFCISRTSTVTIDPPAGKLGQPTTHDVYTPHLARVIGLVNPDDVLRILEFVIGEDGGVEAPSDRAEPVAGWRGFYLNAPTDDGLISIRGANKHTWETRHFAAICDRGSWTERQQYTQRELCLYHIQTRGQNGIRVEENPQHQVVFTETEGSSCMCGVYGYNQYQSLLNQRDTFDLHAYCVAWGMVSCDAEGNFKASDMRIDRAYLVKKNLRVHVADFAKPTSPWTQFTSINWRGIAQGIENRYGFPVSLVDDVLDVFMWESAADMINKTEVED